jgi:hypothetical protein
MLFDPQNPGIGGLKELTTDEQLLVGDLNSISRDKGTIISGNGSTFIGTTPSSNGQVPISDDTQAGGIRFDTIDTSGEKVKYDASDPTAGYIADKFIAGDNITLSEGTGADANKLEISSIGNYLPLAGGTMTGTITSTAVVNPLLTAAESWIGPSSTTGVYFKGGNVGIGTTSPTEILDVNGNINIPTTSSTVGQIKINANRYFHAYSPVVADSNLFVGYNAGNFTMAGTGDQASYNTGVGRDTLKSLTTGYSNSAQGMYALRNNTTGSYNSAQGMYALQNNTTGSYNSAQGHSALYNLTGAYSNNTAIGKDAGRYYNGTTGNLTQISNSLFLGASASALNGTGDTNEIVIGYNAIGLGSNSVVLGNSDITTTALRGNVGIGTTSPTAVLHLKAGTAAASTAPIKLTQASAVVLGTPEAGTIECNDGDLLYYTIKTGPTRKTIAFTDTAPASHAASHAVGAADTVFPADPGADRFLKWDDDPGELVWADVAVGGDVSKVGTPVDNQVGVWTGDGTIEGDAGLTFDTTDDTLSTGILNATSLTASEIVGTNADKDLVSLAVATYPSLTELSYVKGLSSAVQTQIGTKAPSASPTFTGTVTLPKTIEIQDTSADHQYVLAVSELTADRTITLPLLTGADEFVFKAHTQTLTNKRVTKRITALTSHATPTINTDNCDAVDITALAEDITNMTTNLSGTPTNKQTLLFEIKDNGTARDITWGTGFVAGGVALPTTTVISKILTVGFIYSTANALNKWRCVAVAQEA